MFYVLLRIVFHECASHLGRGAHFGKKYEKSNYYARKALTQIFETIQKQVQGLNIEERYNFVSENYSNFHLFPFLWIEKDKSFENVALFSRLNYQGLLQEIDSKQSILKIQENNKELINYLIHI